jgi:competence protein ComEA
MTSFGNLLLGILLALAISVAPTLPGRAGEPGKPIQLVQAKRAVEAPSGTSTSPAVPEKNRLLDINSASMDQLDALPGIGPAYAKKIVDGRPYKRKDELVRRNILPQRAYDQVKDQIIARQK